MDVMLPLLLSFLLPTSWALILTSTALQFSKRRLAGWAMLPAGNIGLVRLLVFVLPRTSEHAAGEWIFGILILQVGLLFVAARSAAN